MAPRNKKNTLRTWLLLALQICSSSSGAVSLESDLDACSSNVENCTAELLAPDAASWLNTCTTRNQHAFPPIICAAGEKGSAHSKPSPQQASSSSVTSAAASDVTEATVRIRNYLQVLPAERSRATDAAGQRKLHDDFPCKDGEGNAVAWFVVIKQYGSYRYVFATSRSPAFAAAEDFHRSGPVHNTLAQTDKHNRAVLLFAYTSFRSTPRQGHQNGVLMFGQSRGFWLVHSWRRLFQYFKTREFPERSNTKGQSFVCTTHGFGDLEDIARQLLITKPNPLWSRSDLLPQNSLWQNITGDTSLTEDRVQEICGDQSGTRKQTFSLDEGTRVYHYAKSAFSGRDIYTWIAADNGIHGNNYLLKVQAWQSGGVTASNPVVVIGEHTYTGLNAMTQNTDHSKWCVPLRNGSEPAADTEKFVCIGDLNIGHASRPGGAICMFHSVVWQYFSYIAA